MERLSTLLPVAVAPADLLSLEEVVVVVVVVVVEEEAAVITFFTSTLFVGEVLTNSDCEEEDRRY